MGNPNSRAKKLAKPAGSSPVISNHKNDSDSPTTTEDVKPDSPKLEKFMAANPGLEEVMSTGEQFQNKNGNGGDMMSLGFKSYKTGTLITANGEPSGKVSAPIELFSAPHTQMLSGATPAFVPTEPTTVPSSSQSRSTRERILSITKAHSPTTNNEANLAQASSTTTTPIKSPIVSNTPQTSITTTPEVKSPRVFFTRAERGKKNIVINNTGVVRNLVRVTERYLPSGIPYRTFSRDFEPVSYDLLEVLKGMGKEEMVDFWAKNWVEIEVDFRNGLISVDGLLNVLDRFVNALTVLPKSIFITIYFPTTPSADPANPSSAGSNKVRASVLANPSPTMQILMQLVERLHEFQSVERMDVKLRTPATGKHPIPVADLNLVLPFYELAFTRWTVKFQAYYMTHVELVKGWPITYLDREWNKALWEREAEARKLRDTVFVRKSAYS